MLNETTTGPVVGTGQDDQFDGTGAPDILIGLAGDDTISGHDGEDHIFGDFIGENLLQDTGGALSFAQYGASGTWQVGEDAAGNAQMSQSVTTLAGAQYEVSFELAANHASGSVSGRVEVLWNDEVIGEVDTSSGVFADAALSFVGTGEEGTLTFRALPGAAGEGPTINTDGPAFWYEKTVDIGGQPTTVKAFAEGQANIYQVLNGELNVFDPASETYTPAGAEATVVVNSIGFNQEDDLIYGIAVKAGTDALGNTVSQGDLVMYDAGGDAYRIGETPYNSWTGDFDGNGNLWAFHSSLDRITKIDVDQTDADGNPLATTFKFPKSMETDQLWDVAYDAASESFFGLVRPKAEGEATRLIQIDISGVENGGQPEISSVSVTSTLIDGVLQDGVPAMTFGAFIIDGDGNFYAGGNGGDHDMNDATGTSGGIYRIIRPADGDAYLELVTAAPKSYSNDGAVDPRAIDPFTEFDPAAQVLIRGPELYEVADPSQSYDDQILAGSGADTALGGYGDDEIVGGSRGDTLEGGEGADSLYGGEMPGTSSGLISVYDEDGLRYDQFGNLLPENDDVILGGLGDDFLHGSAGHDTLRGGEGQDTLDGGTGHDQLFGDAGDDALSGGRESDALSGGTGADTLDGGSGDDTLDGGADNDALAGGSDNDALAGGSGEDTLDGGSGDDTLDGGADADVLNGGSGADVLTGGDGDDNLKGGTQNDLLFGGDGRDKLNGGSGEDALFGEDGKDYLNGYFGDDTLDGGAGNDKLVGGRGTDVLTGGAGSDTFVFQLDHLDGATNTITDFTRDADQSDVIDLREFNLGDTYVDVAAWAAENLSVQANGDVVLDLQGTLVHCDLQTDTAAGRDDLVNDILDGIWF
jgi:serralysin